MVFKDHLTILLNVELCKYSFIF